MFMLSEGCDTKKAMALIFSVAETEHIPDLCTLVNFAYRGEFSKFGWSTEADLLDGQRTDSAMLADLMAPPDQLILIASDPEPQDQIVGCVHLKKISAEGCYLGMLTVRPNLQNKSVCRQLLQEAESWARSWACKEMTLSIIQVRRELIDWYSRRGYKLNGQRSDFPYGDVRYGIPKRDDLFLLGMTKSL